MTALSNFLKLHNLHYAIRGAGSWRGGLGDMAPPPDFTGIERYPHRSGLCVEIWFYADIS